MVSRTRRLLDGIADVTPLRLALWVWLVATAWKGVFTDPHHVLPFMDDHQFFNWEDADRLSIVRWGQLPLWNPYYCGGMVAAAAPEDAVFAPDFLLRVAFGVEHGRRFAVMLFAVLGMEGTYRLVRRVDGSGVAGLFAGAALVLNGLVLEYFTKGWIHFFGFYLAPWVILAIVAGRTERSWRFVGALALGWIALAAGTYTAPYTGIALAYVTVVLLAGALVAGRRRVAKKTLIAFAVIVVGAVAVALAKLLPMMLVMRQYPRVFTPVEINDLWDLLRQYWGIEFAVLSLALVAVVSGDRWGRVFFCGALLFLALAMGQFAPWAPASLMKKLPLVSGLRFPARFMIMVHFFLVFAAARGVTRLEDGARGVLGAIASLAARFARPLGRASGWLATRAEWSLLASALTAALAGYLLYGQARALMDAVKLEPHKLYTMPGPREIPQDFKQARGNRRDAHVYPPSNRGSMYCFVGIPLPESPLLRADLPEEEYAEHPETAHVTRTFWSPHEIRLDVSASAPARIFVNQNYNPHWTTDVGQLVDVDRLLAIDVPAGEHAVTLRYRDTLSYVCIAVSFGAFGAMVLAIALDRARRGRRTFEIWRDVGAFGASRARRVDPRRAPTEDDAEDTDGAEAEGAADDEGTGTAPKGDPDPDAGSSEAES